VLPGSITAVLPGFQTRTTKLGSQETIRTQMGRKPMYSNKPIIYKKDRRQRKDFISSWLEVSGVLVWLVLFAVVLLFQKAQPREKTFFDRLLAVELADTVDYTFLAPILYLLVLLLVLSAVSLFLNIKRLKRRTDHIRISYIITLVFATAGLIFFLIRF